MHSAQQNQDLRSKACRFLKEIWHNQQVGGSIPSGSLGVYCTDIIDWNGSLQFQRTIDTPLRLCGVMVSVPDCLSGGKGSIPFIVACFENVVQQFSVERSETEDPNVVRIRCTKVQQILRSRIKTCEACFVQWQHACPGSMRRSSNLTFSIAGYYQMEDSRAHNPEVAGSSPVPATHILIRKEKENVIYCNDETI